MPRNIALCLSGGGFRATLFHLGVIRALRDLDRISGIKQIYSVSGGSITAAHLVLNWERYTGQEDHFRSVGRELVDFVQRDIRGRILRRWALLGWIPAFSRTNQIIRYYKGLFKNHLLETLKAANRPELFIVSTSMVTGELCCFHSKGLIRNLSTAQPIEVPAPELPVAVAVAASSAFPPMFPPISLSARELGVTGGQMTEGEKLTDGGVFDNLGVRAALIRNDAELLFISDASASFEQTADESFRRIIDRTIRTTDVLMTRVANLERAELERRGTGVHFALISDLLEPSDMRNFFVAEKFEVQPVSIQKWIKSVRTDLDEFSDIEVRAIYRHGYEVGLKTAKAMSPKGVFLRKPPWDPCSTASQFDDNISALNRSLEALRHFDFSGPKKSDAVMPDQAVIDALKRARTRKARIWDSRDPFCWGVAFVVIVLALALVLYLSLA